MCLRAAKGACPRFSPVLTRAAHPRDAHLRSARLLQVSEAFSSLIARIVAQIPNPPEPSLLLRKRIKIGKQLAENKSFRAALFDLPSV